MPEPIPDEPVDEPAGARAFLRRVWQDSDPHRTGGPALYVPEHARLALIVVLIDHDDQEAECRRLAGERLQAIAEGDQLRVELEHEREEHAKTRGWLHEAEEELTRRPTRG